MNLGIPFFNSPYRWVLTGSEAAASLEKVVAVRGWFREHDTEVAAGGQEYSLDFRRVDIRYV